MIVPRYKWSKAVREQWGHKCVWCGRGEDEWYLQAHHIKPKSLYPELETETDNGIALCKRCHKIVHLHNDIDVWDFVLLDIDHDDYKKLETAAASEGKTICQFVTDCVIESNPELKLSRFKTNEP